MKLIFEFISTVYRRSGNRLNITLDAVPDLEAFLDWISVFDSHDAVGFDTVELKGGSENDRHLLLDKMKRVTCIIVADDSTAGLQHEKVRIHESSLETSRFLSDAHSELAERLQYAKGVVLGAKRWGFRNEESRRNDACRNDRIHQKVEKRQLRQGPASETRPSV